MVGYLLHADDVLRRRAWTTQTNRQWTALAYLAGYVFLFGATYGCVMGTLGGLSADRWRQIAYAGIKVPILLVATFTVSLPSFYVVNMLFGLQRDFSQALRGLVAAQAGLAIILSSAAPFTALWYATSMNYQHALLFNAVMFAVASVSAQRLLWGYYRPLIARNPNHRVLAWMWLVVYALVGIQMGWILRPFVGSPGDEVEFFRSDAFQQNAYEVVARLIWNLF